MRHCLAESLWWVCTLGGAKRIPTAGQVHAVYTGHLKMYTCWAVWLLLRDQLLKQWLLNWMLGLLKRKLATIKAFWMHNQKLAHNQACNKSEVLLTCPCSTVWLHGDFGSEHTTRVLCICMMSHHTLTTNYLKYLCSDCLWAYGNNFFQLIMGMLIHLCNLGP